MEFLEISYLVIPPEQDELKAGAALVPTERRYAFTRF